MKKIQKILLKRLAKLRKAYTDYQNNPFDPETAHQVRTNSRKIRSLLNFLKNGMEDTEYQEMNQGLKDMAMIYGPVREVDILIEWCTEIARQERDMSDRYKDLFNHLGKERRREMRRTFNKTNVRTAESAIETAEAGIGRLSLEEQSDWDNYIKKRLLKKYKRLMEEYEIMDRDDYEHVHEIRKRAKKLRFPAQYFGKLSSVKSGKIAKKAEKVQNEIGRITDAKTNRRLLESYRDETADKEMKRLFSDMAEAQEN